MKISPSLASANPLRLEEEVLRVKDQYDDLHIDIEDGNFIPNITFGMKTIRALRSITEVPLSCHLMVTNPYEYLEEICRLSPSIVFVHVESLPYIRDFADRVHKLGCKCGIALNPRTPIEPYFYQFADLDAVLIMTSEPDGKEQIFIKEMLEKVKAIRHQSFDIDIWMDGGISFQILPELKKIGVTHAVIGREIFNGKSQRDGSSGLFT